MSIIRAENVPQIMPQEETEGTTTMTYATRVAAAAAAMDNPVAPIAADGTNLKTPDYHLPWTGQIVQDAIEKILNLDLHEVGGTTIVDSTKESPANANLLTEPGNYVFDYFQATPSVPKELQDITIVNMGVFKTKDKTGKDVLLQIVDAGGQRWYRYSKDNGKTWSDFYIKSTNAADIDFTNDPASPTPGYTPPKDPVTVLQESLEEEKKAREKTDGRVGALETGLQQTNTNITNLQTTINQTMLRLGSEAVGTQIVNGTFDYDTKVTPT